MTSTTYTVQTPNSTNFGSVVTSTAVLLLQNGTNKLLLQNGSSQLLFQAGETKSTNYTVTSG